MTWRNVISGLTNDSLGEILAKRPSVHKVLECWFEKQIWFFFDPRQFDPNQIRNHKYVLKGSYI